MKKLIAVLSMATAIDRDRRSLGAVRRCRRRNFGFPGTTNFRHTDLSASSSGATVGRTVTGSDGAYAFRGLQPGAYTINSNGKSVVTYVGNDGMKVNWGVWPGAEPVVVAEPGATGVPVHSSATTTTTITRFADASDGCRAQPDSHRCRGDDDNKNGKGDDDDRRCPPSGME
jgi:hypothetical protein